VSDNTYELGQVVPLRFEVRDVDTGELVDPTAWTLKVATPSGSLDDISAGVIHTDAGVFDADYVPLVAGPFVAVFAATGEHAGTSTDNWIVQATSASLANITIAQLRAYLKEPSEDDATLLDALEAERAAQARKCRIDPYTPDLRQALMRRVARNLAARSVPIASFNTFEGGATTTRVPQTDPEIQRFEGPYRRRRVG
jgi:hypothetical protein